MILLILSAENFDTAKRAFRKCPGGFKNGHLYEGLARAIGFKTYAAAQAYLRALKKPEVRVIDLDVLRSRLGELGYTRALEQIETTVFSRLNLPIDSATLAGGKIHWD